MAARHLSAAVDLENQWCRLQREFISCASHELRTPLTSILGFSQALLEDETMEARERKQFLSYIHEQGKRLSQIVDDLLLLSRAQSLRGIPLELANWSAETLMDASLEQSWCLLRGFEVSVLLREGQTLLWVDKEKFLRALECLISNAVKFSGGQKRIRITGRKSGLHYLLSVEDEGIGMSLNQLSQVFDPFYRVNASDDAKEGFGLGLAVARAIAKAHGGEMWIKSTLGAGTEITMHWPAEGSYTL